jgi:O-antigen ligase
MLLALQIYFVIASGVLFIYAVLKDQNAVRAFSYGLVVNIFPLIWMPYFSMDAARLAGIPLSYLPFILTGFALFFRAGGKIKKDYKTLLFLTLLYLLYTLITTLFIGKLSIDSLIYYTAWPLNFFIFFAAISLFSKIDEARSQKILKTTTLIIVFGCLAGIFRYLTGISIDANFMPVVNRNGVVVIITMVAPLLFYLYSYKQISQRVLVISLITIFTCLLLIYSRSGLIGFIFGILFYYFQPLKKNILKLFFLLLILVMISGVFKVSFDRLGRTFTTVSMLINSEEFDSKMGDYKRVKLLKISSDIIQNNFWLGTGLGLENYRKEFYKVSDWDFDSKAHNFYFSYFSELGLIGFLMLMSIFSMIYMKLPPLKSRHRSFRISFIVVAIMMTMNEYILLPEIWFFFGILVGISHRFSNKKLI